jgi:hypothetical protein
VSGFSAGEWSLYPVMLFVETQDGSRHHAWGIEGRSPLFGQDRGLERLARELEGELARYTA